MSTISDLVPAFVQLAVQFGPSLAQAAEKAFAGHSGSSTSALKLDTMVKGLTSVAQNLKDVGAIPAVPDTNTITGVAETIVRGMINSGQVIQPLPHQ